MLLSGNPLRALVVWEPDAGEARNAGAPLTARLLAEDDRKGEAREFQAHARGSDRRPQSAYFVELTPDRAPITLRFERGGELEELYRPVEVIDVDERAALVRVMREPFASSPLVREKSALERLTRRVLRDRIPRIWLAGRFVSGDRLPVDVSWTGTPVPSAPVEWATEALVAELFDVAVFGARAIELSTSMTNGVFRIGARIQAPDDQPFSESLRSALRERNELTVLYRAARPDFTPTVEVQEKFVQIRIELKLEARASPTQA